VAVTQNPPGSADRVFLDACPVSLSQQYHKLQHNIHPLIKRNENKNKIKYKELFPKYLDHFFDKQNVNISLQNNIQHLKIRKYYIK
jgi:hypothetical protein